MGLTLVEESAGETAGPDEGPTFDVFWLLYPRKVARKDAIRAWERIAAAERAMAIVALAAWRNIWLRRGELEYVPHPATWLNGERWTDELPSSERAPLAASHVQAEIPKAGERATMPDHVRALIAQLRGRQ